MMGVVAGVVLLSCWLAGSALAAEPAQDLPPGCGPSQPAHCTPSPDGRLQVATSPAHDGQAGNVVLWTRAQNRWRLLYRFDPAPGMGFEFKSWRADGAALRLQWHCPQHSGATQLRDGPYGWELTPAPPATCAP